MKDTEFICTKCPVGCQLQLNINGSEITVSGNTCKIGEKYGISEYTNPVRTITTSVKLMTNNGVKMISVKTNKEVPKGEVFNCLKEIKSVTLKQDIVNIGDILLENILGLGVDLVATREYKI